jgi:hypothetical protein
LAANYVNECTYDVHTFAASILKTLPDGVRMRGLVVVGEKQQGACGALGGRMGLRFAVSN